jgi:hypothetical protein
MRNGTPEVFLAAALALSVGNAAAVMYTFTNIADSSGPLFSVFFPALNNNGSVAFFSTFDQDAAGIITGSGGPITIVADSRGPFSDFGAPSINDSGTVAFAAGLDTSREGIFTGTGGPTTTIADTRGPFSRFGFFPSINNSGTVAFTAFLDPCCDDAGIFTGSSGGLTTTIAASRGPFSLSFFPSINNSGLVAFSSQAENGRDIFTGSGGPTTSLADTSGVFSIFGERVALNDIGTVAFNARLDTGELGVFTGSGGLTTSIADDSGPFDFVSGPSLNNSGAVAFLGTLDTGGAGIFTGPDPLADEVIGTGDPLFGSRVVDVNLFTESLNDNGQIAFSYELADGRRGIARADPLVIPEPGTPPLLLLVGPLLGAAWWCRVNRRRPYRYRENV